jgi:hypothetical protein
MAVGQSVLWHIRSALSISDSTEITEPVQKLPLSGSGDVFEAVPSIECKV